jgi:hypothetical protein
MIELDKRTNSIWIKFFSHKNHSFIKLSMNIDVCRSHAKLKIITFDCATQIQCYTHMVIICLVTRLKLSMSYICIFILLSCIEPLDMVAYWHVRYCTYINRFVQIWRDDEIMDILFYGFIINYSNRRSCSRVLFCFFYIFEMRK